MKRQPCTQLSAPLCYARQYLLGTAPPRIGQGKPFIRWQIRTPTSLGESRIHQICAADHMPLTGPGSTVSRSSLSWPCICDTGVGVPRQGVRNFKLRTPWQPTAVDTIAMLGRCMAGRRLGVVSFAAMQEWGLAMRRYGEPLLIAHRMQLGVGFAVLRPQGL